MPRAASASTLRLPPKPTHHGHAHPTPHHRRPPAPHRAPPAADQEVERIGGQGAPVLKDCLARFDCRTKVRHHVGDHLLIVGEVFAFDCRPGDALTYFRSRYGQAQITEP